MSRAFVKEADGAEAVEELPDRPIGPERNLVTARGLALIEAEVARLRVLLAEARTKEDRSEITHVARDLRYWSARRASAQLCRDAIEILLPSTRPLHLATWLASAPNR